MLCMVAATLALVDQWPQRVIALLQVSKMNKLSILGILGVGLIDDVIFLRIEILILIRDLYFCLPLKFIHDRYGGMCILFLFYFL